MMASTRSWAPPAGAGGRNAFRPSAPRARGACHAGKGFGPAAPQRGEAAAKQAAKHASPKKRSRGARPIDPEEAAQGRLDVVQVQDWGSGNKADLGDLRVASTARPFVGPALAGGPTNTDQEAGTPFYEQLARHLEFAQRSGLMQPAAGAQLPPFERWAFKREHYIQYLSDALVVHSAVEAAIDVATSGLAPAAAPAAPAAASASSASSSAAAAAVAAAPAPPAAVAASAASPTSAAASLACLGRASGLGRAHAIQEDLHALLRVPPASDGAHDAAGGEAGTGASSPAAAGPQAAGGAWLGERPAPSGNCTALAQLLTKLAATAASAAAADTAREAALLQLQAAAYSVYASHLGGGVRIGAAATEKLGLFGIAATACYQRYDDLPAGLDPTRAFMTAVNAAGEAMDWRQRQQVMEELPRMFSKAGLVLTALARVA